MVVVVSPIVVVGSEMISGTGGVVVTAIVVAGATVVVGATVVTAVVGVAVVVVVVVGGEAFTVYEGLSSQLAGPSNTNTFVVPTGKPPGIVYETLKAPSTLLLVVAIGTPPKLTKISVPGVKLIPLITVATPGHPGSGLMETSPQLPPDADAPVIASTPTIVTKTARNLRTHPSCIVSGKYRYHCQGASTSAGHTSMPKIACAAAPSRYPVNPAIDASTSSCTPERSLG